MSRVAYLWRLLSGERTSPSYVVRWLFSTMLCCRATSQTFTNIIFQIPWQYQISYCSFWGRALAVTQQRARIIACVSRMLDKSNWSLFCCSAIPLFHVPCFITSLHRHSKWSIQIIEERTTQTTAIPTEEDFCFRSSYGEPKIILV